MTKIEPKKVAKLREKTGLGMMACKKALKEAEGKMDKAEEILAKKTKGKLSDKGGRQIKAGLIEAYVHQDRVGVLLKVGSETDFVAKNKDFRNFAHDVALQIASMDPADVKDLLAQPFIKNQDKTVQEVLEEAVAKTGEKIEIAEFTRYEIGN